MFGGPWPLRRRGRLNWLLLPLSRGLRVCLFFLLTSFVFFSGLWPLGCGGRLNWLYCRYLGVWGPETTLDPFLFFFCFFQCLVGGLAECRFSRTRPTVNFKNFRMFSDLGILVGLPMLTSF